MAWDTKDDKDAGRATRRFAGAEFRLRGGAADINFVHGSTGQVGTVVSDRRQVSRRRQGRLVALLETLSGASGRDSGWARDAGRDERARTLEGFLAGSGVRLLNDRRVPGARATVDHLAVGSRGIMVILASHETGRARVADGRLVVNGDDRSTLVADVRRQVEVIRLGLAASPNIPVGGAICWMEADGLPRLRKLSVDGVRIDGPRALAEELRGPGPVSPRRIRTIASVLDRRLPSRDMG